MMEIIFDFISMNQIHSPIVKNIPEDKRLKIDYEMIS